MFGFTFGLSSLGHYFSHYVAEKIGDKLTIIVDTLIGQEQWINNLAKKLKPALDREDIRTSADGAGGLSQ